MRTVIWKWEKCLGCDHPFLSHTVVTESCDDGCSYPECSCTCFET